MTMIHRVTRLFIQTAITAVLAFSAALPLGAQNWAQWRGPNFNGSTEATNLPTTWNEGENVLWKAPLPGPSGATPIIWNDHIFVSSPDSSRNLNLICIRRADGEVLWTQTVGIGDRTVGRNNMASPSPVTDGERVIALFGTGDLAAFDFDGKELWSRNLGEKYGKFSLMWLYGSSPLLHENRLYIQVLQRDPPTDYTHAVDSKPHRESFLLCLDPATGEELWRQLRPTDATKESQEAYSTPIPNEGPGGTEIIVVGGNYTTGHHPTTGEELWRAGGLNPKGDDWWRIVPSPVPGKELIYISAPKRDPVFAIEPNGRGDVTETHLAWQFNDYPTDWSTPLLYQGKLFVLDGDRKMLTCLDPETGAQKWQGKIEVRGQIWCSPSGADGRIYVISESGTAVVLSAGDEFKVLGETEMREGPVRSSIAVAHNQIFIRTAENLYCIAGEQ